MIFFGFFPPFFLLFCHGLCLVYSRALFGSFMLPFFLFFSFLMDLLYFVGVSFMSKVYVVVGYFSNKI